MSQIVHLSKLRNNYMNFNRKLTNLIFFGSCFSFVCLILSIFSKFFFILYCLLILSNVLLLLTSCFTLINIMAKSKKITKLLDDYIVSNIQTILNNYSLDTTLSNVNVNWIDSHHYSIIVECNQIAIEDIYSLLEDLKQNIYYSTNIRLFFTCKPTI